MEGDLPIQGGIAPVQELKRFGGISFRKFGLRTSCSCTTDGLPFSLAYKSGGLMVFTFVMAIHVLSHVGVLPGRFWHNGMNLSFHWMTSSVWVD